MTDKEKAINWFENIADECDKLTSGNVAHLRAQIKGMAIRSAEYLMKHSQEPASEDMEQAAQEYTEKGSKCQDEMDAFIAGAQWQKEREFTHIEPTDNGYQAAIHYMEDCQEVDDFARRGITWIAERYFIQGAKWREKQYLVSKDMEIAFKEYAKREHCECDLETSGEPIQYDSTNDLIDACRYGALLQKEQMMKNAIECHIDYYDGPILDCTQKQLDDALEKNGTKVGDRVKVIIIKE